MVRLSGEKSTVGKSPIRKLLLFSWLFTKVFLYFSERRILISFEPTTPETLAFSADQLTRSASRLVLKDFVVESRYNASTMLVLPWALSPTNRFNFLSNVSLS